MVPNILKNIILIFVNIFISTVLSIGFFTNVQAQEDKQSFIEQLIIDEGLLDFMLPRHSSPVLYSFPQNSIDTSIDVLSYDVSLDWVQALTLARKDRPERKFTGRVQARVVMVGPNLFLTWHARNLKIDSVFIDGSAAEWVEDGETMNIIPGNDFTRGDTITLDIYYAGLRDNLGFYAFAGSDVELRDIMHPIAFTFSEPENARSWFPSNDVPYDKALFTAHVRVPSGITVVSNGTMTDSIADTDTTTIQSWHHPEPMSTYLFTVNASVFQRYDQEYTSGNRTIPILNFDWPEDHQGPAFNAVNALRRIPDMFEGLERRLGEYPWPTYGHVTVSPIQFGGMEHQSMTTVNRRWLIGDIEAGYAHELAHQWLGDAVTGATWADIWLGEGGATLSEALWREYSEGPIGYQQQMMLRRNKYLEKGLSDIAVYNPPMLALFNEGTTYAKAGWIYHMIRGIVGDALFFPMLQTWVTENNNAARQTKDFIKHIELKLPSPPVPWQDYWQTFFDQWLLQRGHPVIGVELQSDSIPLNGIFSGQLTVNQYQSGEGVPDVFVMPLPVRMFGNATYIDTVVFVDRRKFSMPIEAPFIVDRIEVDPNNSILLETIVQSVTSVNDDYQLTGVVVMPSPVKQGEPLTVQFNADDASVKVFTLQGTQLYSNRTDARLLSIDTSSWASGAILLVVESGGLFHTQVIPVLK